MRRYKLLCITVVLSVVLSLGFALPAAAKATSGPQTYTVMVGLENPHQGIGVMAYFPRTVTIHEGDTVHWVQNSNEIHTVTFPDGILPSDVLIPSDNISISPLMFSPFATEQTPASGSDFSGGIGVHANSGIMGREPGQVAEYDLVFPNQGTYGYLCLVHGAVMSGEVVVVPPDEAIPSPSQSMAEGRKQMAEAMSMIPGVVRNAASQVVPPEMNGDGTVTHTVMIGYSETVTASYGDLDIELLQFFPDKMVVRPGDNVTFEMSPHNLAPHTVTFLNGEEEPSLVVPSGGFLYINPEVLLPSGDTVLMREGIFSSGLMLPIPGTSYSFTVGDIGPGLLPFECLLHDTSGMDGDLMVVPRR